MEHAKVARGKTKAQYPILSDEKGQLIDAFKIRDKDANPMGGDAARSAMFLVDANGTILWRHETPNYRVRPSPEQVLEDIKAVLAK